MLESFFRRRDVRYRVVHNAHADLLQEYVVYLDDRGNARRTIRDNVLALEHFDSWLFGRGISLRAANHELVCTFLHKHLPHCRCPSPSPTSLVSVRAALNHLLKLLQDQRRGKTELDQIGAVLDQFGRYLRDTGGLSDNTCLVRLRYLRRFLQGKFGQGRLRWNALRPNDIIAFVTEYALAGKRVSAQGAAGSLRSFLRFLHVQGWCKPTSLIAAVPRIPDWRLARLPKRMTEKQLRDVLAAFDRSTAAGRRDYAMALCMVELGLRASEVAGLRLDDIDWRNAAVNIKAAKMGRSRELPLPMRVGRAIAQYLRNGRPATVHRNVFIRHPLRQGMPISLDTVRCAMQRAYVKVQGCERWTGTHILRHTAATRILRRGGTLKQIADLLGHHSINTTVIYAKVDLENLAAVAMPWPKVQP